MVRALLLAGALACAGTTAHAAEPAAFAAEGGIAYETRIEGAAEIGLAEVMERASLLIALSDKPPPSLSALRRRVRQDAERLKDVLRSNGFYDGTIAVAVAESGAPRQVTLRVDPGVVYLLGDYAIEYAGRPPAAELRPDLERLELHLGMRADAARIVEAEQTLLRQFRETGYPWTKVAKRSVRLDHAETLVRVHVAVDLGRRVGFGPLLIEGLEQVQAAHVRRLVPWQPGETYAASRLEEFRRTLTGTGLFAAVGIEAVAPSAGSDRAPIKVVLRERAHRSIGAGVNYASSEGPGAKVFWEHRNFLGARETLRLTASGNLIEQTVESEFRKPAYVHTNQHLLSQLEVKRFDGPAFEQLGVGARLGLERRTPPWRTAVSGAVEAARVEDDDGRQLSALFGLPVEMGYDSTDNLLNPTRGARAEMVATPYAGVGDDPLLFAVFEATGSVYQRIDAGGRLVIAGRARVGTVLGEDRQDLPANKRFYTGGGGSIRGYEFQTVGPLSNNGEPEGGLSVVEVGAEARVRVIGDFGLVGFVDGGKAVDTAQPFESGGLQWAAGVGLRYHTAVGPLRLDIAVPLNGRDGVDEDFQFYVSLGQAF